MSVSFGCWKTLIHHHRICIQISEAIGYSIDRIVRSGETLLQVEIHDLLRMPGKKRISNRSKLSISSVFVRSQDLFVLCFSPQNNPKNSFRLRALAWGGLIGTLIGGIALAIVLTLWLTSTTKTSEHVEIFYFSPACKLPNEKKIEWINKVFLARPSDYQRLLREFIAADGCYG